MSFRRLMLAAMAAFVLILPVARAERIQVVGWNLESGDAKRTYLSDLIGQFQGVDLWGFSEVKAEDADTYAAACAVGEGGQQFKHFVGTTGGSDRLVIVYNATKLDLVEQQELLDLRVQTGRAPLYGVFKSKATSEKFIFMVNHLHRGNAAKRMEQAVGLEKWAKTQSRPAIFVGDYNFDVKLSTKKGNPAFEAMLDEGVFRWVEPAPFRATHKSGSVLDFVFLTGTAKGWGAKAEVTKLVDDEIENQNASDHRPVLAELNTSPQAGSSSPALGALPQPADAAAEAQARQQKRNEILRKLADLERELALLRRMVKELADE